MPIVATAPKAGICRVYGRSIAGLCTTAAATSAPASATTSLVTRWRGNTLESHGCKCRDGGVCEVAVVGCAERSERVDGRCPGC